MDDLGGAKLIACQENVDFRGFPARVVVEAVLGVDKVRVDEIGRLGHLLNVDVSPREDGLVSSCLVWDSSDLEA